MITSQSNSDVAFDDIAAAVFSADTAAIVREIYGNAPELRLEDKLDRAQLDDQLSSSKRFPEFITSKRHISSSLLRAIGSHGAGRLEKFLAYDLNWDSQGAVPVSMKSLELLETLASRYRSFASEPSIFVTPDGHLMLAWEDSEEQEIEIEFRSDSTLDYWIERRDLEGNVNADALSELLANLDA